MKIDNADKQRNIDKRILRNIAEDRGKDVVIQAAKEGVKSEGLTEQKFRQIINLYKSILDTDDL